MGDGKCIFESDAKLLVDAVKGSKGNSYFDIIAEDCSELFKHFEKVLLVFVHRSVNHVAHLVARMVCYVLGLHEWNSTAPHFIACNLAFEEI